VVFLPRSTRTLEPLLRRCTRTDTVRQKWWVVVYESDRRIGGCSLPLVLLGLGSCVVYGVMTWLSFQFIYGQGHQQRPILTFLACYGVGFLLYGAACWYVRRSLSQNDLCLRIILGFAICFRVILLLSTPIQEDDFYRYLWDGKVVASGLNPYLFAPQTVREARAEDTLVQPYARIAQHDPGLALILSRVNHPEVPTIYPPLAQGLFALSAMIAPGNLFVLRVLLLGCDLALCWLLVTLLRHLMLNPSSVVLYAWSPLVIKETINSAHYDVLPALWLMVAVFLSLRGKVLLTYASVALAVLGKVYPLLLLPLFACRTRRTHGCAWTVVGLGMTCLLMLIGYAPFWQDGGAVWQGTRAFAERWQTNSFLFSGIRLMVEERWVANAIVALLSAGVALGTLVCFDLRDAHDFLWAVFLVLGVMFLLSPVGNPWYFLWIVPLLCVFPLRSWLLLSALLGLYYLYFYFLYHQQVETFRWVIWLEYVPFYVVATWEWARTRRKNDA
jgi:alpha-1,6-mannosyltransferase